MIYYGNFDLSTMFSSDLCLGTVSDENGEHPISFELSFSKSARRLLIAACANSLCCVDVEYERLMNFCIAVLCGYWG